MNNKTFLIVLSVTVLAGVLFFFYKGAEDHKRSSQVVLAKELNKAMSAMMMDLSQASAGTVKGVPADGKWYHAVYFQIKNEAVQYRLNNKVKDKLERIKNGAAVVIAGHVRGLGFRRMPGTSSIIQVQILVSNDQSLPAHFNIRMKD